MSEPRLTHGGRCLTLAGKVYLLAQRSEEVWLTTPAGAAYVVTARGCSCPDAWFRGRACKHRRACAELGLLGETIAAQCEGRYDGGRGGRNPDTLPEADQGNPRGARADAG